MQANFKSKFRSLIRCITTRLLVVIGLVALSPFFQVSAQDSTLRSMRVKVKPAPAFPVYTPVYSSRNLLIDSLNALVSQLRMRQDSLVDLLKSQRESINASEAERARLSQENKNLQAELDGAMGDNLQSNHTNSILFIFNVIVGVILLIALVWMFVKKKSDPGDRVKRTGAYSPSIVHNNGIEQFDKELERIEKLGSLREKGLLTDDEFNLQKKQILGDKG